MTTAIQGNMMKLSSGYQINKASDDAAGMSITEKMTSQKNGYDVGNENAKLADSVLNVADGALSTMYDSLSRIREIGLKASNSALYSKDELSMMQDEINQIKAGISDVAKNTEFNGQKLLDGSMATMELATNPSGKGHEMTMVDTTLEKLGIADFDVTKSFNLKDIDKALKMVTSAQSNVGAQSNRLAYTMMTNQSASYNLTNSISTIKDTKMEEQIAELKKNQVLEQVAINMQKKKMEQEQNKHKILNVTPRV